MSKNSFLVEIEHNKDIDWKVRKDIEEKFKKSNVNASYIFPRISQENSNLPKIKLERRHVSQFDATFNACDLVLPANGLEGKGIEIGTAKLGRIPILAKKSISLEKKTPLTSVTPYPYFRDLRKSGAGSHRNTPSPVPNWRSLPYDKKRML
jgi:hypothetical protein